MIALYILAGLLLLLGLILSIPVHFFLCYQKEEMTVTARWLLWRRTLYPTEEPAEEKAEPAPAQKKKPPSTRRRPLMDWLQLLNDMLPQLQKLLQKLLGRITLRRCRIRMVLAAEEAADTAIRYGRANALLYSIYAVVSQHMKVREFSADLRQDYRGDPAAEAAEAEAELTASPLAVITAGLLPVLSGGMTLLHFFNTANTPKKG